MSILKLAEAMNAAAGEFDVGRLQELRKCLCGLSRVPCKGIFGKKSVFDDKGYAFHLGGRTELQFNIGEEEVNDRRVIRHGLAFSLETNKTLKAIDPLVPKIMRFNEYVLAHPEDFPNMRAWHFDFHGRSEDRSVGPISDDLIIEDNFIMLGRWVPAKEVNVQAILADFDRLLLLYLYVESDGSTAVRPERAPLRPGCPKYMQRTSKFLPARTVDVALRHKALQPLLHELLSGEFDRVESEYALPFGGSVDAVAEQGDKWVFFELKIASDVRACVRGALGQLLEYSCWPSTDRASELIVVGEHAVDHRAAAYLRLLRERFHLPIWYRYLNAEAETLGRKS